MFLNSKLLYICAFWKFRINWMILLQKVHSISLFFFFRPKNWVNDFIFGFLNVATDGIPDPFNVRINTQEHRGVVIHMIAVHSNLIDRIFAILFDSMHKWIAIKSKFLVTLSTEHGIRELYLMCRTFFISNDWIFLGIVASGFVQFWIIAVQSI